MKTFIFAFILGALVASCGPATVIQDNLSPVLVLSSDAGVDAGP